MPAASGTGAVVYQARGGIDAIDAYSRRLIPALAEVGIDARYFPNGLGSLGNAEPAFVLLQYNPFAYGRSGFAPGLVRDAVRLRRRTRVPLVLMVHEAWVNMADPKSTAIGVWQRAQLRALLRLADGVIASTQALARELGRGTVHVPVPANITPTSTSRAAAREHLGLDGKLTVALYGRANPARALDHAAAAIVALADTHGPHRLAVLNLGADAPPLPAPTGVEIRSPGPLPAEELSQHLLASHIVLLPFTDGISTRRGTLMAALAHGRPVLGSRGPSTDEVLVATPPPIALEAAGDVTAFAQAAVELSRDKEWRRTLGETGRALYESQFDWPVLARRVASLLES